MNNLLSIFLPKCPYCQRVMSPTSSYVSHKDGRITTLTIIYEHSPFAHTVRITKKYKIQGQEVGEDEDVEKKH